MALGVWASVVWVLLTWTPFTLETEAVGLVAAAIVAWAIASFGGVARPWLIVDPRRLLAIVRLFWGTLRGIVVANLKLTRLIWTPSLPLRSGMVIVPTAELTDGGLAAVGLISSLIVDNQIVDVDRASRLLQYHAVCVPDGDREQAREAINGPIERMLEPLVGGRGIGAGRGDADA
ncbi:MAG TPA: Na+/H+ antiporter subunit E [Solirubrobacteraceae bacterium]|nr:Na+/H+ antiporter subunit E [Solirubrobacteraceae bacterium]